MPTINLSDNSKGILVTAKEFVKGEKGDPGKDGYTPVKGVDYFDGKDGYTPVKGVDYFDGAAGPMGPEGPAGKDGSIVFEELTDEQREMLRGPIGETGPTGPKGDSYVITEEDKADIAAMVMGGIPTAEEVKF